jgi:carbon-monoxide dehydrogenase small subunit
MVTLSVNGGIVEASVAPRTHLADFLRETLNLTGTHLGCEHGVCGACTVLLDGAPARACLAFAALCEGAKVLTIEGLADDPLVVGLRAAFTAEHALQCGYCTPGMLVTARDILVRLPDADEARIRLELAGNLCRCTGYEGIVRAIMRSQAQAQAQRLAPAAAPVAVPASVFAPARAAAAQAALPAGTPGLSQVLRLAVPAAHAWAAVQDIALIAACVPGLALERATPNDLAGMLTASFGPISARFAGTGCVVFADRQGTITAQGRDAASRTALTAEARFTVRDADAGAEIAIDIAYSLRGPLAQLARPAIVARFASEILGQVAARLDAALTGQAPPPSAALPVMQLVRGVLWRWWRGLFGRV